MIDQVLGGRYRLRAVLGRGGMATVYEADDSVLGREVAIKLLNPGLLHDPELVARFEREARAAARLTHPNIVSVFDVGGDEHSRYIVMELVNGYDLKTLIEREGPFPPSRVARLGMQLAEALAYAHSRGVVHRDVKPQNILVDANDHLKVTDFGIAQALGTPSITQQGWVLGSVHYMAPEQARGEPTGPATDIYAAGVVLFEMATGRVPFAGANPVAVAIQRERGVADEAWAGTRVPTALRAIIDRAMATDPRARFATAADLHRALQNLSNVAAQATQRIPLSPPVQPRVATAPPVAEVRRGAPRPAPPGSRGGTSWPAVLLIGLLLFLLAAAGAFAVGQLLNGQPGASATAEPRPTRPPAQPTAPPRPTATPVPAAAPPTAVPASPTSPPTVAPTATPPPTATATPVPPTPTSAPTQPPPSPTVALVALPPLLGRSQEDAVARLSQLGLVAEVRRAPNNAAPGIVVAQDPPPGAQVPPGSHVQLTVSSGPALAEVPDVRGLPVDQGGQQLRSLGLTVTVKERKSARPAGTIVDQTPEPGTRLRPGSSVTLFISRGG